MRKAKIANLVAKNSVYDKSADKFIKKMNIFWFRRDLRVDDNKGFFMVNEQGTGFRFKPPEDLRNVNFEIKFIKVGGLIIHHFIFQVNNSS